MGKMALGYGSEFHLLRWLGRHRIEFNKRIKNTIGVDNVTWLDFNFDKTNEIPDKELIGLEFLENEPEFNKLLNSWKNEWPQSGNSMNWDLIGYTINKNIKTWILIEAKAHLGEIQQSCGASSIKSKEKIKNALCGDGVQSDVLAMVRDLNENSELSQPEVDATIATDHLTDETEVAVAHVDSKISLGNQNDPSINENSVGLSE